MGKAVCFLYVEACWLFCWFTSCEMVLWNCSVHCLSCFLSQRLLYSWWVAQVYILLTAEIAYNTTDPKRGFDWVRQLVEKHPNRLITWNCYYKVISRYYFTDTSCNCCMVFIFICSNYLLPVLMSEYCLKSYLSYWFAHKWKEILRKIMKSWTRVMKLRIKNK